MAMSGAASSTLTIADGAAIINGYTYETNGSVTISTSGLTGTYNILLIANVTAGTVTVTANGAGTTTVAASTIRCAIATSAQTTTITTAVGADNVITLGTVVVAAGTISAITNAWPMSTSLQVPALIYGTMDGLISNLTVTNATYTTITNFSSSVTSGDGLIVADTGGGQFTVNMTGLYLVKLITTWDANTTGSRWLQISGTGFTHSLDYEAYSQLATNLALSASMSYSNVVTLTAGGTIKAVVYQNSGAARIIGNAQLKIVKL